MTRFVEAEITAAISLSRRFCVTSPHRISRACIFFVELHDESIAFC